MVSRLLIRNGRVVDPSVGLDQSMDLLLEDGAVGQCGERLEVSPGTPVIDAAGLVVAPGFIDARAHLGEPGFEQRETIASGCRAAVAGGYTAVCCLPSTYPVHDEPSHTRFILERARAAGLARVYPIGALSKGQQGQELAEIGGMVREGVIAIGDDARPVVSSMLMRRALEYARSFDLPVISHPQDPNLAAVGCMNEGEVATRIGLAGIPAAAEAIMVARDIFLCELTSGRLHLAHLSSAKALDLVAQAKQQGVKVTCEVSPLHFTLSDRDVEVANYDPNWKVNPPLRSLADVEVVKQRLADGTVDLIASDHQPQHQDDKELDFSEAPFGAVGLETSVSLTIDVLLHGKVIDVPQLVRLLSTGPAEVLGIPGGTLQEGVPADVTLLDLRSRRKVNPRTFSSLSRNTPCAGMQLKGRAVATIVGGKVVWHDLPRAAYAGG